MFPLELQEVHKCSIITGLEGKNMVYYFGFIYEIMNGKLEKKHKIVKNLNFIIRQGKGFSYA